MPNADLCFSDTLTTQLWNSVMVNPKCYCIPYLIMPQIVTVSLKPCSWEVGVGWQTRCSEVSSDTFKVSSRQLLPFCFIVSALLSSWYFALGRGLFLFGFTFGFLFCFLLCLWEIALSGFELLGGEVHRFLPVSWAEGKWPHSIKPVQLAKAPSWEEKTTSHPSAPSLSLPWLLLLSPATRKAKSLCEL